MKTSSCKAKGRRLQQEVRDSLLEISQGVLESGDILSRTMGEAGVDLILSPAAKEHFGDLGIECKNCESLNVTGTFFEHSEKHPEMLPLLIHKRNRTETLCTMRWRDIVELIKQVKK